MLTNVLENKKKIDMQHLQPNTTLQGGKYRIERVLGQGGFGITYLAVQTSLQRYVAIKESFRKDLCGRDEGTMTAPATGSSKLVEQYRKKFIKEARNLARLHHPNIITVMDVFEENNTVYYVMPYLAGGSLQDYVKTHGTLSETESMKYVRQIASALKYMHEEQHICHYDVKPANILLDDKDNAVLIDFGISKNYDAAGHETTTTPVGKSEGYAPIEQYQQNVEEFSPASDVYALGATLYYLLHGKRPVSAVHRASGTALLMSRNLSQGIKDLISASMKISKRERVQNVNVFMRGISTNARKVYNPVNNDDENTIIDNSRKTEEVNTSFTQHHVSSTTDGISESQEKSNSSIAWIIGIAVVCVIGFFFYTNQSGTGSTSQTDSYSSNVEDMTPSTVQSQETNTDIYKERVEQFSRNQSGIVASYSDDRYSVYYSKKDGYGSKYLYRYDAIADKSEKINLPIMATSGGYTNHWVTKNRYIFIAAEERFTDFIKVDTKTGQIKYITDCNSVQRTSSGFTVQMARCINEETATCAAEMQYAYTDYYYDEEGNCMGHREEYR